MPLFGAHLSIAGGRHNALLAAQTYGMDTVQIFTASSRSWNLVPGETENSWRAKPLPDEEVAQFSQTWQTMKLKLPLAHDTYLINLASPNPELYRRSVEAFVGELNRAEQLGLAYLVTHPGAATDGEDDAGLARVATALDEVHERCPDYQVMVLLETTAGQGSSLGHRFEHLARIRELVKNPERLGVCLDTCHVFAAGYSLATDKEYKATMKQFDKIVGLGQLKAFHLNDSMKELGSRVDRHAAIGQGHLGLEPFRFLINDRRFRKHPMILETPKEGPEGEDMDPVNLNVLRELIA